MGQRPCRCSIAPTSFTRTMTLTITVGDDAVVRYGPGPDATHVHRFAVRDRQHYAGQMTRETARILALFPVAGR